MKIRALLPRSLVSGSGRPFLFTAQRLARQRKLAVAVSVLGCCWQILHLLALHPLGCVDPSVPRSGHSLVQRVCLRRQWEEFHTFVWTLLSRVTRTWQSLFGKSVYGGIINVKEHLEIRSIISTWPSYLAVTSSLFGCCLKRRLRPSLRCG